eukprot:5680576-Pyramimonas_sp.AAC.1
MAAPGEPPQRWVDPRAAPAGSPAAAVPGGAIWGRRGRLAGGPLGALGRAPWRARFVRSSPGRRGPA